MCNGLLYTVGLYRRSDTDIAYGGATWRVMFQNVRYRPNEWRYCVPIQISPLLTW